MLEELHVKDFALIEDLAVRFTPGFNILSGETGAGKSILIGALGLLLGMRGDTGSIRTGCEETVVSATVNLSGNAEALSWLDERDIAPEEGAVIIRRVVKQSGRGSIFIQSSAVNRADLRDFTSLVFDLHGQHEHQSLLSVDQHRKLLDRFGDFEDFTITLQESFHRLTELTKKRDSMESSERERLREMDILSFSIKEIEEAKLRPGEEEELDKERNLLSQHEKLFHLLETVHKQTAESRGGALSSLREAQQALQEVAGIDNSTEELATRLVNAFYEVEDISESVRQYQNDFQFRPERLEEVEERIVTIHNLEKKYGDTIEDLLQYYTECSEKLDELSHWEEDKESLQADIQSLEKEVYKQAYELSEMRKKAAKTLEQKIEERLHLLGMPKASFNVMVEQKKNSTGKPLCGSRGFDMVEFTISPNVGEPPKPLKDIASGGELSRIMLAIKSILAETDTIQSLIFDEVDSGIGGQVAVAVGEHLHSVSRHKQVLCITHLASIAVRADNHLQVNKKIKEGRTITEVLPVEGEFRVKEISRMLSGDTQEEASLTHAQELLKKYGKVGV